MTTYEHSYPLDNEAEISRLQNQHDVIKDAMGALVLAPVDLSKSPLKILDSGTADGTWIRDLQATCAPVQHQFYGTDINPADFPADPPASTVYQVHDVNKPWPEDWNGRFDLVHQRFVLVAGGPRQKEAVESLGELVKPGGWIQLIEATNVIPDTCGPVMHDLVNMMRGVFKAMGADVDVTERIPGWLRDAGFVDVGDRVVHLQLGARNPDATLAGRGVFSTSTAAKGLASYAKTLPQGAGGVPVEKLETLGSDLEEELIKMGGAYPVRVVWGRKAT
ncbi:hypothetical protein GGR52DRAFT_575479 [Hypoxylon sp. FL1284]|nr:hypothetical protein GGR52DRAFT_575479 [Hypoxylon sp. FL1284]